MVPSLSPSQAPSISPSQLPTVTPTVTPSASPSALPSIDLTAPTLPPSVAPSRAPSLSPSVAPSAVPSAFLNVTTVSFSCDQVIDGCSATDFLADAQAQATLVNTIAAAASNLSTTPEVTITSVSDSVAASVAEMTSLASVGKAVTATGGMTVTYIIKFQVVSGSAAPFTLYATFTDQLVKNVQDQVFLQALLNSNLSVFASANVSLSGLSIGAYTVEVDLLGPTSAPTKPPSSSTDLSDGEVAAIVICSIVGVGVLAFMAYYFRRRSLSLRRLAPKPMMSPRVASLDANAAQIEGFYDVERMNSPTSLSIVPQPPSTPTPAHSSVPTPHDDTLAVSNPTATTFHF